MFYGCDDIIEIDLSHFDTSNVKDMGYMFSGCTSLTSLDLSNFNTSSVIVMDEMFPGCTSLTFLDLHNFDASLLSNCIFNTCFQYIYSLLILEKISIFFYYYK